MIVDYNSFPFSKEMTKIKSRKTIVKKQLFHKSTLQAINRTMFYSNKRLNKSVNEPLMARHKNPDNLLKEKVSN